MKNAHNRNEMRLRSAKIYDLPSFHFRFSILSKNAPKTNRKRNENDIFFKNEFSAIIHDNFCCCFQMTTAKCQTKRKRLSDIWSHAICERQTIHLLEREFIFVARNFDWHQKQWKRNGLAVLALFQWLIYLSNCRWSSTPTAASDPQLETRNEAAKRDTDSNGY